MYRKIVVGHDLHPGGRDALALGRILAGATGAKLVVAGVFPFGALPRGFEARWREHEEEIAAELQNAADEAGATAEAFPSSSPAKGLHDLAEEIDADLVVVGSSRHSPVGQILAGNVGLGLLHGSPFAVSVAPRGYGDGTLDGLTRLVVGFDGSAESWPALRDAVELASATGAGVTLVAVAEPPPGVAATAIGDIAELEQAIEDHMREQLEKGLAAIPDGMVKETRLAAGDPAENLAEAAEGSSLLILGSRGYGPVGRVLLGSVSSALVRGAPCPVLVHPRVEPGDSA